MKTYLIILALLGVASASHFRYGCLVQKSYNGKVNTKSPVYFQIEFPLNQTTIELTQNQDRKLIDAKPTNRPKGWTNVRLEFYPYFRLQLIDGTVLLKDSNKNRTKDVSTVMLEIKNAKILFNCSEEEEDRETVFDMSESEKTLNFDLDKEDEFIIIPRKVMLTMKIQIANEKWGLCDEKPSGVLSLKKNENPSCSFQIGKEYSISFNTSGNKIEILDENNATQETVTTDDKNLRIDLSEGDLYLVHLKKVQEKPTNIDPGEDAADGSWMIYGIIALAVLLVLSLFVNCILFCIPAIKDKYTFGHGKTPVEKTGKRTEDDNEDIAPVRPERPGISNTPHGVRKQSNEEESRYHEGPIHNPRNVTDPDDEDYINPNDVKPIEVILMQNKNIITGQVTQAECFQHRRLQPQTSNETDYVNLPDSGEYAELNPHNYHSEEPVYSNLPLQR